MNRLLQAFLGPSSRFLASLSFVLPHQSPRCCFSSSHTCFDIADNEWRSSMFAPISVDAHSGVSLLEDCMVEIFGPLHEQLVALNHFSSYPSIDDYVQDARQRSAPTLDSLCWPIPTPTPFVDLFDVLPSDDSTFRLFWDGEETTDRFDRTTDSSSFRYTDDDGTIHFLPGITQLAASIDFSPSSPPPPDLPLLFEWRRLSAPPGFESTESTNEWILSQVIDFVSGRYPLSLNFPSPVESKVFPLMSFDDNTDNEVLKLISLLQFSEPFTSPSCRYSIPSIKFKPTQTYASLSSGIYEFRCYVNRSLEREYQNQNLDSFLRLISKLPTNSLIDTIHQQDEWIPIVSQKIAVEDGSVLHCGPKYQMPQKSEYSILLKEGSTVNEKPFASEFVPSLLVNLELANEVERFIVSSDDNDEESLANSRIESSMYYHRDNGSIELIDVSETDMDSLFHFYEVGSSSPCLPNGKYVFEMSLFSQQEDEAKEEDGEEAVVPLFSRTIHIPPRLCKLVTYQPSQSSSLSQKEFWWSLHSGRLEVGSVGATDEPFLIGIESNMTNLEPLEDRFEVVISVFDFFGGGEEEETPPLERTEMRLDSHRILLELDPSNHQAGLYRVHTSVHDTMTSETDSDTTVFAIGMKFDLKAIRLSDWNKNKNSPLRSGSKVSFTPDHYREDEWIRVVFSCDDEDLLTSSLPFEVIAFHQRTLVSKKERPIKQWIDLGKIAEGEFDEDTSVFAFNCCPGLLGPEELRFEARICGKTFASFEIRVRDSSSSLFGKGRSMIRKVFRK